MGNNKQYKRIVLYVDEKKYEKAKKKLKTLDRSYTMSRWVREMIDQVLNEENWK